METGSVLSVLPCEPFVRWSHTPLWCHGHHYIHLPMGLLVETNHQSLVDSFLFLMLCDNPSSKIPVDLKGRCAPGRAPQGKKSVLKKVPKGRQTLQSILNFHFLQFIEKVEILLYLKCTLMVWRVIIEPTTC